MSYLSDHKKLFAIYFFALVVFLGGCNGVTPAANTPLEFLEAEGELVLALQNDLQPARFEMFEVTMRDLIQTRDVPVNIVQGGYPVRFQTAGGTLSAAQWEYGRFEAAQLSVGQIVREGDFLGELFFELPTSFLIDRDALLNERADFERTTSQERSRREAEIFSYQMEHSMASNMERDLLTLRIRQLELELERFIRGTTNRRLDFADRLERLELPFSGERLYSPIDGVISWINPGYNADSNLFRDRIWYVWLAGQSMGRLVVGITDSEHVTFVAQTPAYVLRFGDIVTVNFLQGDIYFNMRVATDPLTQPVTRLTQPGTSDGFFDIELAPVCEDEFNSALMAFDMTVLDLNFGHYRAQVVLPLALNATVVNGRAIMTEGLRNYVLLYENGSLSKRYVLTGVTLDGYVQILSGLEPGQTVVIQ